jgi:hypothetical protein
MKNISSLLRVTAACIGIAIPTMLLAQQPVLRAVTPVDAGATHATPVVSTISAAPAASESKPLTDRWLDLKTLSFAQRYRNTYNSGSFHDFENGQQRSLLEARIKLDPEARYTLNLRASSGRYFNWAYADYAGEGIHARIANSAALIQSLTLPEIEEILAAEPADPAGVQILNDLPSAGWEFSMRELYVSASPVKPISVEFGFIGIERGLSTEITTFDDDGYLDGERIRVRDPKHLFFDQVGFTNAYFGDYRTPNLFDRGNRFADSNYRQVFVDKKLNSRVALSGEYTWQFGTNTLREAVLADTKETKAVDKVRFEAYERMNQVNLQGLNINGASGFAVTAYKDLSQKLTGDAGFASIDKDNSVYTGSRYMHAWGFGLNGDTYSQGKRPFTHASYKVNPVVTAFAFYTHAVGARVSNIDQQTLDAGFNFDLKALANTGKRIF